MARLASAFEARGDRTLVRLGREDVTREDARPFLRVGFKEEVVTVDGVARMSVSLALVGTVRKADPDRVALKRVILTGVPFKTHKSKAVVRFMFHNPDDIRWFKPLELWTKYGMRGKIKDAIGTHGHMKCLFNGVIQQRDTICATMYKRVYPKFPLA